jgi:hypothetical protein
MPLSADHMLGIRRECLTYVFLSHRPSCEATRHEDGVPIVDVVLVEAVTVL